MLYARQGEEFWWAAAPVVAPFPATAAEGVFCGLGLGASIKAETSGYIVRNDSGENLIEAYRGRCC